MSSNHRKRLAMPRTWALPRKRTVWISKADPCGHSHEMCMPLSVIIRDELGLAQSKREVKRMLATRQVFVDGRVPKSVDRGVGLMDVLTIGENNYRCILDKRGKLRYLPISASDANSKICRIDGKTTIKGGVTQYNLHDGRNILLDKATAYNTGDSLVISLPDQTVRGHHAFEGGATAYLVGGTHVGTVSQMESITIKRSSMENEVAFPEFGTVKRNVFILGDFSLPEVTE